MDFQFQHDLPGYELDEEWEVLLATQARMLSAMLTCVADTVATVTNRPHQEQVQRLSYLLSQSEQFLTTLARQYVGIERETAVFRAVGTDARTLSSKTVERLRVLDQVTTTLHANLTAARRYLTALRHTMEYGERRL